MNDLWGQPANYVFRLPQKSDQVGAREAVPHLVSHQLGAPPPPISYILVHRWAAQITATTVVEWGQSGGGIMTATWLQRKTRRINWPGGFNNSPRSGQYGQELAKLQLATVAAVAAPTESYKSQLWLLPRLKTVARQVARLPETTPSSIHEVYVETTL